MLSQNYILSIPKLNFAQTNYNISTTNFAENIFFNFKLYNIFRMEKSLIRLNLKKKKLRTKIASTKLKIRTIKSKIHLIEKKLNILKELRKLIETPNKLK